MVVYLVRTQRPQEARQVACTELHKKKEGKLELRNYQVRLQRWKEKLQGAEAFHLIKLAYRCYCYIDQSPTWLFLWLGARGETTKMGMETAQPN